MTEELLFKGEAAAEYDRAFAHVTRYFMPFLLRAADVTPGMRVLDIAIGTSHSAEAALNESENAEHPCTRFYYNGIRTHLALGKDAPMSRPVQSVGRIAAMPVLGGLHHHYVRIA
jgi:hypothetical protein